MKIWMTNLLQMFNMPVPATEEERRRNTLNILLWAVEIAMSIVFLAFIVFFIFTPDKTMVVTTSRELYGVLFAFGLMLIGIGILIAINRFVPSLVTGIIFLLLIYVAILSDKPTEVSAGRSLLYFTVLIVLSSLIVRPWASFVVALASSITITFEAYAIPILPDIFAMTGFFVLATTIWFISQNLEGYIKKLAEVNLELQESEAHYRKLVEILPEMVLLNDLEGNILMANQAGAELFGYSDASALIGRKNFDFVLPEDRPIVANSMQQIFETGKVVGTEIRAIRQNGAQFYLEINGTVLGDKKGVSASILVVGRDISLRKQEEQRLTDIGNRLQEQVADKDMELQRANERLTELVVNSPAVIYSAALGGENEITFISRNVGALTGFSSDEFTRQPTFWLGRIHPEDRATVQGSLDDLLQQGRVVNEYRFMRADGTYRWMRDEERLVKDDESGKLLEIVGSWIDITKEKEVSLALQESEERYSHLVNYSPDAIVSGPVVKVPKTAK